MRNSAREAIIGTLILAGLVASVWLYFLHKSSLQGAKMAPFVPQLAEYQRPVVDAVGNITQPYLRGKIVTLSGTPNYAWNGIPRNELQSSAKPAKTEIDPLFLSLDDSLRAKSPAETGSVVWLNRQTEQIGTYHSPVTGLEEPAYAMVLQLVLVDQVRRCVVGKNTWRADPPASRGLGKSRYGEIPLETVRQYLLSLDRIALDAERPLAAAATDDPMPAPVASLPVPQPESAPGAQPPLIPVRDWHDRQGRTLAAELESVSKDSRGAFVGVFRRPSGEQFQYVIGNLSAEDVQLVKEVLTEKGIYKPEGSP